MTTSLSPVPVAKFFDNSGLPLALGSLTTYQAGTTTPQVTYVDSTQTTTNTNPITLNSRGECNLWLDPTKSYKFLLQDAFGNIIPGYPVDNITIGNANPSFSIIPASDNLYTLGNTSFSWANLYLGPNHAPALDTTTGNIGYYGVTAAETSASVTPTAFVYPPGDIRRYGAVSSVLVDCATAFTNCLKANGFAYVPPQTWYAGSITVPANCTIHGEGALSQIQAFSSGQTTLFNAVGTGFPTGEKLFIRFKDVFLFAGVGTGATAINAKYCDEMWLDGVIIDGGFRINIQFADGQELYLTRCRIWSATAWNLNWSYTSGLNGALVGGFCTIDNSEFFNCTSSGISSSQKASAYFANIASCLIMHTKFNANSQKGLQFAFTNGSGSPADQGELYVISCEFDSNADTGVLFDTSRDVSMMSCWVSSGRTNAVPGVIVNNCVDTRLVGNDVFGCGGDGILVENSNNIVLTNNACNANGQAGGASSKVGIHVTNSTNCQLLGNTANNVNYGFGSASQATGISSDGTSDFNTFIANSCASNLSSQIFFSGTHDIVKDNRGILVENSGVSGAIATGATVSHGLSAAPTVVLLTAADGTPTNYFPSTFTSSTFTVTFSGGGSHAFYWIAKTGNAP